MLLRRARLQKMDIWDAGHSRNVLGEGWIDVGGGEGGQTETIWRPNESLFIVILSEAK